LQVPSSSLLSLLASDPPLEEIKDSREMDLDDGKITGGGAIARSGGGEGEGAPT